MRRLFALVATVAMLFVFAVPVHADSPCPPPTPGQTWTCTVNIHNATVTFPSVGLPCLPDSMVTITYNSVDHITINGAGDVWVTGTQEGSFMAVPFANPANPASGHFAIWFGFSLNNHNAVFHDTFNLHGTFADGTPVALHLVDHYSVSATGTINTFMTVTC
jgi:hypothetical protein